MNYRGLIWARFDSGSGSLLELFTGGTRAELQKKPDQQSIVLGLRVDDMYQAVGELTGRVVQFIPGESGEFEGQRWAHFTDIEGNQLEVKEVPLGTPGPLQPSLPRDLAPERDADV